MPRMLTSAEKNYSLVRRGTSHSVWCQEVSQPCVFTTESGHCPLFYLFDKAKGILKMEFRGGLLPEFLSVQYSAQTKQMLCTDWHQLMLIVNREMSFIS